MPSAARATLRLAAAATLLAASGQTQIESQGEALSFALKWCADCHSGREPEGDLNLPSLLGRIITPGDLDRLVDVKEQLEAGTMPPDDEPRPSPEAVSSMASWTDALVTSMGAGPGRVTVRRLSRFEYNRTIDDLFGVHTELSGSFPPDDLGYGFDTIGDAMSFSTLHLEKYAAAAADIADRAIVLEDPDTPPVRHLEAEGMRCSIRRSNRSDGFAALVSNGEFSARLRLPRAGDYLIRVRAYGDQAGGQLPLMAIRVDGQTRKKIEVPQTRHNPAIHELRTTIPGGPHVVSVGFTNDYFRKEEPDRSKRDRNLLVDWVEVVGPVDPTPLPAGHRWILSDHDEQAIAGRLVHRVWRRPAQPADVERLSALMRGALTAGAPVEAAARLALQATLVSPNFLYRIEPGELGSSRGSEDLSGHALASRLSYFIWSSTPDDELLALAAGGQLRDPAVLVEQARRMLAEPRASALSENFAGLWLELRRLAEMEPDPDRFPSFSDDLRADMQRETQMLFESIVREQRSVRDLLDADYTFMNERLARHYGVDGVSGDRFRKVTVTDDRRRGILGHAAIHTITSHPTHTSPVRRGKWILDQILDDPPPPPPPGNDAFSEEEVGHLTTLREKLAVHRAKPECASCHDRMDSLGLALENFDPIGRWRDEEHGAAIDASGALPGGRKIDGPAELRSVLMEGRTFVRCVLTKLFLYAVGREPAAADRLELDRLSRALPADPTVEELVIGIVRLDAFRRREMMR